MDMRSSYSTIEEVYKMITGENNYLTESSRVLYVAERQHGVRWNNFWWMLKKRGTMDDSIISAIMLKPLFTSYISVAYKFIVSLLQ